MRNPIHFVGQGDDLRVVSCHDEGFVRLAGQFEEQPHNRLAGIFIQVAGWLIGEQQRGVVGDSPQNGNALLLPPGKVIGEGVLAVLQADPLDEVVDLVLSRRCQAVVQLEGQGDIFKDGQGGDEIKKLEDKADMLPAKERALSLIQAGDGDLVDEDRAVVGRVNASNQVEESALAGAALAEEQHKIAGVKRDVDVVQNNAALFAFGVAFGQVFQANERFVGHR